MFVSSYFCFAPYVINVLRAWICLEYDNIFSFLSLYWTYFSQFLDDKMCLIYKRDCFDWFYKISQTDLHSYLVSVVLILSFHSFHSLIVIFTVLILEKISIAIVLSFDSSVSYNVWFVCRNWHVPNWNGSFIQFHNSHSI